MDTMDDAESDSLEERLRRVRTVLAAAKDDPRVHENARSTATDALDRINRALEDGLEDEPPDELFDAEPIKSDGSLDELFESGTQENSQND